MGKGNQTVSVKVISAAPADTMRELNRIGIVLQGLHYVDDLTVQFFVRRADFKKMANIIDQRGDRLVMQKKDYSGGVVSRLLKRPVLLFGAALILGMTLYIPSRILFIRVEGNSSVTSRQIIAAAENHGLLFGSARQKIRSEKIKNALLSELPQLQWVGVNTKGCVATISVRERLQPKEHPRPFAISSIIAGYDGVIREMTVSSGNPVCKVGQAVQEGELLVSGYSDCGICIHGTTASAEIFADTQRNLTVTTPSVKMQRSAFRGDQRKIHLLLGKKQIFFSKDSGICDTTCGKMYKEYYLSLPGGFQLPVGIAIESIYPGKTTETVSDEERSSELLGAYARQYLLEQMISGVINKSNVTIEPGDETLQLKGIYLCSEMIGKTRCEETIDQYGEAN